MSFFPRYFSPLFLILGFLACNTTKPLSSTENLEKVETTSLEERTFGENYHVWKGSSFEVEDPEKKPAFSEGGYKGFTMGLYTQIRYPAEARQKGVAGTVWIEVILNEFGQMEGARLREGIGAGCDEEALKVVRLIASRGFSPAQHEGKPIKVKFDVPVRFRLE